ncbi:nuclear transport factor 2 family protein [Microbacterium sp. NPDC058021]|uniref:nuclear transport factor 2 family protein n=1 Tax=Microbacterium sp. NPDC058021 TaxID=3346306 RepID=UPI0036D773D1
MSRTRTWLDGYTAAWKSEHPDDVRALFTEDAEYWFRPDDAEPARGIDAILDAWPESDGADPRHDLSVLIENDRLGIISGSIDYPGDTSYVNLWEVHFAPDGRAKKFVEWFMPRHKPTAG